MGKSKTALFSLGAHGTIGGGLTFQKGKSTTIVRSKPTPPYSLTLPQQYQRWLYQDYAYLWTQQSDATKALYRSAAVPFHLTAFQYWMKYQLANLPDIAAWYRLDRPSPLLAQDFSPNENHATIFGASPAPGVISNSLFFDGINDYLKCPLSASLTSITPFTIELFIYLPDYISPDTWQWIIGNETWPTSGIRWAIENASRLMISYLVGGINPALVSSAPFSIATWHHLAFRYDGTTLTYFIDGLQDTSVITDYTPSTTIPFHIGIRSDLWGDLNGYLDNIIFYNRHLDAYEILRHSRRRYP